MLLSSAAKACTHTLITVVEANFPAATILLTHSCVGHYCYSSHKKCSNAELYSTTKARKHSLPLSQHAFALLSSNITHRCTIHPHRHNFAAQIVPSFVLTHKRNKKKYVVSSCNSVCAQYHFAAQRLLISTKHIDANFVILQTCRQYRNNASSLK